MSFAAAASARALSCTSFKSAAALSSATLAAASLIDFCNSTAAAFSASALAFAAANADCRLMDNAAVTAVTASAIGCKSVSTPVIAAINLVMSRSFGLLAENSVA